ncbi:MAG TPA: TetR/AcrR family transcriptional regulator [Acidimicrobiales bacterium]|nr:TetR/AcrR family transcriptional regulator [Acidimicrobiales bacterium]
MRDTGKREIGQGKRTERDIYAAAVDLIFERGFHGTSLRAVAATVGLQMSSLYYHFASKQDLLIEIMSRSMQDLISAVEKAVSNHRGEGPTARLQAAIRGHILFHAGRRKEAFILDNEMRALEPAGRELVMKLRDQYEQIFAEVLAEGAEQGVFRFTDTRLALLALMAMCTGVAVWYRPDGRLPLEDIAESYTDLFFHGLVTPSKLGSKRRGSQGPGPETSGTRREGVRL